MSYLKEIIIIIFKTIPQAGIVPNILIIGGRVYTLILLIVLIISLFSSGKKILDK